MRRTASRALRVAFGESVTEIAGRDSRVVMLDGDVGVSTRADIFEAALPDRFFQMGIAEQNMFAVAAGFASVGFIPFVSTFACFAVARALDSIRVLIAQPKLDVKIVGGYAGLLAGKTGKTHMMFDDVSIMRAMANMSVVAPADAIEARQAVEAAVEVEGPVYLRITREVSPLLFDPLYRFKFGKAVVIREGSDVSLISTGVQTCRVVEAAELLSQQGIDASVLHLPTVKPLDSDAVVEAARETGFVVVIEEGTVIGGLGGAVAETLADRFPVTVKRLGILDVFGESGTDEALLEKYRLSPSKVAEDVLVLLGASPYLRSVAARRACERGRG
jgi:transketolase